MIHVYPLIYLDFSETAESISGKNNVNADNYHYFSYDNKGGITGVATTIGWLNSDASGSVCIENQNQRTAISEWLRNDATAALVIHLKID